MCNSQMVSSFRAWEAPGLFSPGIVKPHDLYMCDLIYLSSIKINIKNTMNMVIDSSGAVSGSKTLPQGDIYYSVWCQIVKAVLNHFVRLDLSWKGCLMWRPIAHKPVQSWVSSLKSMTKKREKNSLLSTFLFRQNDVIKLHRPLHEMLSSINILLIYNIIV